MIPTDAYAQPRRGPFRPDALGAWLAAHPTDAITPPSEVERPDPIEIDAVSTERDFTRVLRVCGELHLAFEYAVPTVRQHDLVTPGTVTAWSVDGRALAYRLVAAVAHWRTREAGRG